MINPSVASLSPKSKSHPSGHGRGHSSSHMGYTHSGPRKSTFFPRGKRFSKFFLEEFTPVEEKEEEPYINYREELTYLFFNSCIKHIIKRRKILGGITLEEKPDSEIISADSPLIKEEDAVPSKLSKHKKQKSVERERSRSKLSFKSWKAKETLKPKKSNTSVSSGLSKNTSKKSMGHNKRSPSIFSIPEPAIPKPKKDKKDLDWIIKPEENMEIIQFCNGNTYEGRTAKWLMHGKGEYIWANGTRYKGDFKDGFPNGKGEMMLQDLSTYEGDFCRSLFHGNGVFCIASTPCIYKGSWRNGKKHGQGWFLYEQDNWYEGDWFEDNRHGIGLRRYGRGTKYKGMWSNNQKHGRGSMVWENNDFYVGEWRDGKPNGYGEYNWNAVFTKSFVFPYCNWYKGNWVDGMRSGIGIMNFGTECGAKLIGTWRSNDKHGAGIMICGNGLTLQCNPLFVNNKAVHRSALITTVDERREEDHKKENVKQHPQIQAIETRNDKEDIRKILHTVHSKVSVEEFDPDSLDIITQNGMRIYDSQFVKMDDISLGKSERFCPLEIPIHAVPEDVDLEFYINIIWDYYFHKNSTKKSINSYGTESGDNERSRLHSDENVKSRKTSEGKMIRNTITSYLSKITDVYNRYATIMASENEGKYKAILIRLFFWQLLRDMELPRTGISLVELDMFVAKNPRCCLESDHSPFEPIYLWQFIQALLGCACMLFLNKNNHSPGPFVTGTVANLFRQFLEEQVFPSTGKFLGTALTTNKDVVPIKSLYSLYLNMGEPITVSEFLTFTCTEDGTNPPCYCAIDIEDENSKLTTKEGSNATIGNQIIYFEGKENVNFMKVSHQSLDEGLVPDPFYKTLYTFRNLGRRKIISFLHRVCPPIVKRRKLRHDYKLTFLEFYETVLLCAFAKADEIRKTEETSIRQELEAALLKGDVGSIMSKLGRSKKKKNRTYNPSQTS